MDTGFRSGEIRRLLSESIDNRTNIPGVSLDQGWQSILAYNVNEGYQSLQHMGWVHAINNTDRPYITSDRPVTHNFFLDFNDVESTTLQLEGREIYCPISPNNALVLLDPSWYDEQNKEYWNDVFTQP